MRLAFAVAAHLEPDILVVDEVLAVGDAEFQRKCLGKMEEVSRREGRTILVVSHNMGVVTSLCPQIIWLEQGSVHRFGSTSEIVSDYLARGSQNAEQMVDLTRLPRKYDDKENHLRLESIEWLSELPLMHGEDFKVRINLSVRSPVDEVSVVLGFSSLDGNRVLSYRSDYPNGTRAKLTGPGSYSASVDRRSAGH